MVEEPEGIGGCRSDETADCRFYLPRAVVLAASPHIPFGFKPASDTYAVRDNDLLSGLSVHNILNLTWCNRRLP